MPIEKTTYSLLIIEDNDGDFYLLKDAVCSALIIGKIVRAENMVSAIAAIKNDDFDVAFLDLSLPDSDGVDSLITLDEHLQKTPIIVLSGIASMDTALASISLGAQDYLIKGQFDEKILTKSIWYSIQRKRITEDLRETNERYEMVNKATQDTIWEWDYRTDQGRWGAGLISVFGYTESKLRFDDNWITEYVHPDDRESLCERMRLHVESGIKNWNCEYRFRCSNGSYKNVLGRGYILFDKNKKPRQMIGAMTDITEKKKLETELIGQKIKQQKLITETYIEAQEKEKNEIGRELHDNVNQILASAKMYLGMVRSGQYASTDLLEKASQHLDEAMGEIRKLSHSLVAPSIGDIGLREALHQLVSEANLASGLRVDLHIEESFQKKYQEKNKDLMFYRIVQEQLNNIYKHALATRVVISLKCDIRSLSLSISDDGIGFDPASTKRGIGLKNILSRIEFYCGTMEIISAPSKGCTLNIHVPF